MVETARLLVVLVFAVTLSGWWALLIRGVAPQPRYLLPSGMRVLEALARQRKGSAGR
jgi:hypothetical protein